MCKVASIVKVTDENRTKAWDFMKALGTLMSQGNRDGLGYAAFNSKGQIFGEKWLVNDTAFTDLTRHAGMNSKTMNALYEMFGESIDRDDAQGIILHTRAATCEKGIKNVHPFVDNVEAPNVAIIHNGMINNHRQFVKKHGTCDSEVLAHLYKEKNVSEKLDKLGEFTVELQGWYTVLNLLKDSEGRMIMDAYTNTGSLDLYHIKELGTEVYSTRGADIREIAAKFGYTVSDRKSLFSNTAIRVDVLTGEITHDCPVPEKKRVLGKSLFEVMSADGTLTEEQFQKWYADQGYGDI